MKKHLSIFLFLFLSINNILAIPLKQEITKQGHFSSECQITYIPNSQISDSQDIFNGNISLKYGVISELEINLNSNLHTIFKTSNQNNIIQAQNEQDIRDLKFGIVSMLKKEDQLPSIIGFVDTTIVEKKSNIIPDEKHLIYFNNWHFGATICYTNDPLMLYLTIGYIWTPLQWIQDISYDEADIFYIQPIVDFIVNPDTTLFGGFTLNRSTTYTLNQITQTVQRSEMIPFLGYKTLINKELKLTIQTDLIIYPSLLMDVNYQF